MKLTGAYSGFPPLAEPPRQRPAFAGNAASSAAAATAVADNRTAAAPQLMQLDVDAFVAEYRKQLSDAGNAPDVVDAMVRHQQRMFSDFVYFQRWNAATSAQQQQMIFASPKGA